LGWQIGVIVSAARIVAGGQQRVATEMGIDASVTPVSHRV
jgi:hypothetical protein